ncbi:MAG: type II toxin-antitoxin system VapC family toxin [Burkholderiaceae bacterium]|nr:type II toxin-antitoxin system VapC family toxin [Burkholderiaceae bacterium]
MITVDASVWIGFLDLGDPFHAASDALLRRLQASDTPHYSPEFAALEVACALARRHRDADAGRRAADLLRSNGRLRLVATARLLPLAEALGCRLFLRGADAFYAATAQLTATPLVTWDRELIERAGAVTSEQWFAQQPSLE